jgi:hypothetical protein
VISVTGNPGGWIDTGLTINAGDTLQIEAVGSIQFDAAGRMADPDGNPDGDPFASSLVPTLAAHTLVGRIGASGSLTDESGFLIGSSFNQVVSASGKLFLGFNDGYVKEDRSGLDSGAQGDNSGAYTVNATVGSSSTESAARSIRAIVSGNPGGWLDTGLIINSGDTFRVEATGSIQFDTLGKIADPDGVPDGDGEPSASNTLVPGIASQTLVGRIGTSGSLADQTGFLVGSSHRQTAITSGTLFLGFNDAYVVVDRSGLDVGAVGDNSGSFEVSIVIE